MPRKKRSKKTAKRPVTVSRRLLKAVKSAGTKYHAAVRKLRASARKLRRKPRKAQK